MIPIPTYPPTPPTIQGDNITASAFAKNPNHIARRLRDLSAFRYVGGLILPRRVPTTSGSITYDVTGEAITAADAPEVVAPGAEYQITQTGTGSVETAATAKIGQDEVITDEAIARLNYAAIDKALTKLSNTAKIGIDTSVISAVNTSVTTNTTAAGAKWDTATPKILLDLMKAKGEILETNLGYNPDLLLVSDEIFAYLASDSVVANAMAREDKSNPIYTGRFPVIAGLEVMSVPSANLPGGLTTSAFVLDRSQLGFILTEDLGGGYQSAGDLVEVKSWRPEDIDGVRVRVRANFKAVITDPLALYRITAVL